MHREPWEWCSFSDLPMDIGAYVNDPGHFWLRVEYPARAWIRTAVRNLGPGALLS